MGSGLRFSMDTAAFHVECQSAPLRGWRLFTSNKKKRQQQSHYHKADVINWQPCTLPAVVHLANKYADFFNQEFSSNIADLQILLKICQISKNADLLSLLRICQILWNKPTFICACWELLFVKRVQALQFAASSSLRDDSSILILTHFLP